MPEISLIEAVLKHYNLLLPRPHNTPLVFLQKVPSTLIQHRPILLPHLLRLNPPIPLPHRPSILPCLCPPLGPFNHPSSPLPPHPSSSTFACVLGGRADKPQSAPAVQNEEADFTLVDRKRKRKVSRERHESKQQAKRGTWVNIDCRWAPPVITKLWVSLPKQGAAMTTISQRITKIISECRLPETTIKRRRSKNGFTTPFEIYGSQEVIKTLSDPGQWEKKCWMTLYTKKFLLPTDYGANDEKTLKMGVRQQSPMKPAPGNQYV